MTDEEIEKIDKKVLELQKAEGVKTTQSLLTFQEVQQRYHHEIYSKFGTTGRIDDAIKTVATYSQGQRYVTRLSGKEFDNAVHVADKLYKLVLGEKSKQYMLKIRDDVNLKQLEKFGFSRFNSKGVNKI